MRAGSQGCLRFAKAAAVILYVILICLLPLDSNVRCVGGASDSRFAAFEGVGHASWPARLRLNLKVVQLF